MIYTKKINKDELINNFIKWYTFEQYPEYTPDEWDIKAWLEKNIKILNEKINKECTMCKKEGEFKNTYCNSCFALYQRSRRYGISIDKIKKMDMCEICNVKKATEVDHCHKTNKFRGFLCKSCNVGIGHLKDDKEILQKAVFYINK